MKTKVNMRVQEKDAGYSIQSNLVEAFSLILKFRVFCF